MLASSQYSERPANGHLDTGFSWFPRVNKQMLRFIFIVRHTQLNVSK